jgi:hypothetical protein
MRSGLLLAIAIATATAPARADVTSYTNRAAFEGAIGALAASTIDFESLAAGTVVPSGGAIGGDVSISYAFDGGVQIVVVNDFATTSGANSLGTQGDLVFLAGDSFELGFPPSLAVGLSVIGEDMLPGDVTLEIAAGSATSGEAESILPDGSQVFFVGLVESDPGLALTSATLTSIVVEDPSDYAWNVDDVVTAVPEPGAALGALAALTACAASRRARRGFRPSR